jgi:hypothetical protein
MLALAELAGLAEEISERGIYLTDGGPDHRDDRAGLGLGVLEGRASARRRPENTAWAATRERVEERFRRLPWTDMLMGDV